MRYGLLIFVLLISLSSCQKSATPPSSTGDGGDSGGDDAPVVPAELRALKVSDTDSAIQYGPTANHIYRECDNGSCSENDRLFLFFPGSDGAPSDHTKIAEVMGKTGIRVLVLAYQNNGSLQTICGTSDACYSNSRNDRVEGSASSAYVASSADGIKNRLLKALQTLGWTQFYSGTSILWSKIIVGGFSQGAGMAAWIGKHYSVARVCQFSGTWDHTVGTTPASWLSGSSVTSVNFFYGFTHRDDSISNGVGYLDLNWQQLGMGSAVYQLYTTAMTGRKIYAQDSDSACAANTHGCSVQDSATPLDGDGNPRYASVWKYVCGR